MFAKWSYKREARYPLKREESENSYQKENVKGKNTRTSKVAEVMCRTLLWNKFTIICKESPRKYWEQCNKGVYTLAKPFSC